MLFYSANTLFTRMFGVFVIKKQSENNNCKVLCVLLEVMNGSLQNKVVYQLKQTNFGHLSTPKFDTQVNL